MANDRKDFMCKYLAQLELPCKFDQKEAYSNEICTKCYQKNVFCIPPTNRQQDRKEKVTKWIDYTKIDGICLECPKEQYECHDCEHKWFGTSGGVCNGECTDSNGEKPYEMAECSNEDSCSSLDNLQITWTEAYKENLKLHPFGAQCTTGIPVGTKKLCSSCKKDHQVACLKGGGLKRDECLTHW